MKLAELLAERKNIGQRVKVVELDIFNNVKAKSEEDRKVKNDLVNGLVVEYRDLLNRSAELSQRIGKLNSQIKVVGFKDMTLTEAVAKRNALVQLSSTFSEMLRRVEYDPYGDSDQNSVPVFDVKKTRQLRDGWAAMARKLDIAIQATNWSVEIVRGTPAMGDETNSVNTLHETSTLGNVAPDDLLQEVAEEVVEAPNLVDQGLEVPENIAPQRAGEPSVDDRARLQESLAKAQNTPRDKDPNCPIEGAGVVNGVDIADMAWAVFDVYRSTSQLAQFLKSTGDPTLKKVSTRTIKNFVDRNFHDQSDGLNVPQV